MSSAAVRSPSPPVRGIFIGFRSIALRLALLVFVYGASVLALFLLWSDSVAWLTEYMANDLELRLITLSPIDLLVARLRISATACLFLYMPAILAQVWAIMGSALDRRRAAWRWPIVALGSLLFYAGCAVGFSYALPVALAQIFPEDIGYSLALSDAIVFATRRILTSGLLFMIPVAVWMGYEVLMHGHALGTPD